MCTGSGFSSKFFNPTSRLLQDKFKIVDPLGAKLERVEAKAFAGPGIQAPPPPPQEMKAPDMAQYRQKRTPGGGTILTGTSGVGSYNTGGSTLLGG